MRLLLSTQLLSFAVVAVPLLPFIQQTAVAQHALLHAPPVFSLSFVDYTVLGTRSRNQPLYPCVWCVYDL